MKNLQRKNNLFIIITMILLAFASASVNEKVFCAATAPQAKSVVQQASKSNPAAADSSKVSDDKSIPEKNAYDLTHMQKGGVQYALLKFLLAMLGVGLSALVIFFGLKLYQKIILKNNAKYDSIDYDKKLESPKDFKEAINIFLDKTDK